MTMPDRKRPDYLLRWVQTILVALGLVASGGALYVLTQAKAIASETNKPQDEKMQGFEVRLMRLETQRTEDSRRLERIEVKLDRALERP